MAYADGNIVIGTSVDVGGMNTGLYKIQRAMKRLGALMTVGLTAGLYKLSRTAIDAASDLQEIQNVVDVAFKDMSYKIEEFSKVCIKAFGMSELSAKQTAGSFMAMGASIGLTQEAASDMAVELTGLTGDFASFYNISQQYAKVALSAVYTGETETLKRYGIILTEANLQEYANTIGIQKKVKAMSAAEKTLLRYNYIMEATNNMHNDFERTQHSWANTVRVLQENWNALMAAMGSGLIKVFQPIVECLSIIVQKLLAIIKYVNELLGITSEIGDAEFTEEIEDMGDAMDDTAKKAKNMLAPFDKLNNITSSSTKSAKDDTKVLEDLYDRMGLAGYVIEKLKGLSAEVETVTEQTKEKLKDLVNLFRRAIFRIQQVWNNIKLQRWFSAGSSLGEAIASLQRFLSDAISGVNWTQIGENIGTFFEGIIWSDALGGWVDVLISALNGLVDMAIAGMNKISIADIIQLAKNYSKAARKVFKWLYNTIKKVDWHDFGKKIGTFISNLDWLGFFKDAAGIIWQALIGALSVWTGLLDANPMATTLITALVAAISISKWVGLNDAIKTSFSKAVKNWKKAQGVSGLANIVKKAVGVISIAASLVITISNKVEMAKGEKDYDIGYIIEELVCAALMGLGLTLMGVGGIYTAAAVAFYILLNCIIDLAIMPSEEQKDKKKLAEFKEKLFKEVDWVAELEETIETVVNLKVHAEGRVTEVEGDMGYYRELAKQWLELGENYDALTEGEKELLSIITDQMVTKFPELAEKINAVTKAYEGTNEELAETIELSEKYMLLQAYQDNIKEYYDVLAKAQNERYAFSKKMEKIQKTQDEFAESEYMQMILKTLNAQGKYQELVKKYGGTKQKLIDAIMEALRSGQSGLRKDKYSKTDIDFTKFYFSWSGTDDLAIDNVYGLFNATRLLSGEMYTLDKAVSDAEEDIGYWSDLIAQTTDEIAALKWDKIKKKFDEISGYIRGALDNLDEDWRKPIQDALDTIQQKLEAGEEPTREDMQKLFVVLDKGLAGLPDGQMKTDLDATLKSLWAKITSGEVTAEEAMNELAKALNKGFGEGLGTPEKGDGLFKTLDEAQKALIKKVQEMRGKITESARAAVIKGVYDATTGNAEQAFWDSLSKEDKAKYSKQHQMVQKFGFSSLMDVLNKDGENGANSLIDGYDKTLQDYDGKNSGANVVGTTVEGMREEGDFGSPSKVTEQLGLFFVEGFVNGIVNNLQLVRDASSELMDATTEMMSDVSVSPSLTILPQLSFNSNDIPDIAKGLVLPTNIEVASNSTTSIAGMSKKELQGMIESAVAKLQIQAKFQVEGDPYGIFKVVDEQATIYKNMTGNPAFQG